MEQTIKDLNDKNDNLQKELKEIKFNNKKTNNKENKNIDKNSSEYLYNSIYIYENIGLEYQQYRESRTYRKLLEELEFHDKIGNKSNYTDVTEWINKYEKTNFKSIYFENKYKRSKFILDKYKNDLYYIRILKFSISYISNISEKKFNEWLNILDEKISSIKKKNKKLKAILNV